MWIRFFFFKQKTAYEMRISDWSSDVCSSDLDVRGGRLRCGDRPGHAVGCRALSSPGETCAMRFKDARPGRNIPPLPAGPTYCAHREIGRASCRERVCPYV